MFELEQRSVCVVIGCKNSSAKYYGSEYICSTHFSLVPTKLKKIRTRAKRLSRRRLEFMVWERMKKIAQHRAAGL